MRLEAHSVKREAPVVTRARRGFASTLGVGRASRLSQPGHPHRSGFTLVEVLMAVGAFAIVLVSIHMVFHSALRLRNKTASLIENALPLQQTCQWLRRDLANLVLPGGVLFGPLQSTADAGLPTGEFGSAPLATTGDSVPGQASPEFYTATARIDDLLPWGEIQRVSYRLADPTNQMPSTSTGRDLVRSVTRNLLPVLEEPPEEQRLMGGVESILFYYHDGRDWVETWDSATRTNQLPSAIKVAIQLTPPPTGTPISASVYAPVELVVPIVLRASTNQTTSTGGGAS